MSYRSRSSRYAKTATSFFDLSKPLDRHYYNAIQKRRAQRRAAKLAKKAQRRR